MKPHLSTSIRLGYDAVRVVLLPVVWCILWYTALQEARKHARAKVRKSLYERGFDYAVGELLRDPENLDRLEDEAYGWASSRDPFDFGMSAGIQAVEALWQVSGRPPQKSAEEDGISPTGMTYGCQGCYQNWPAHEHVSHCRVRRSR